jgi:hypothetical protein
LPLGTPAVDADLLGGGGERGEVEGHGGKLLFMGGFAGMVSRVGVCRTEQNGNSGVRLS